MILAALAAGAVLIAMALAVRGAGLHVSFGQFLCYTLAVLLLAGAAPLAYWAYAAATLRYELWNGALLVRWGLTTRVVPLGSLERVVLGRHLAVPEVEGLRLPGLAVGRARVNRVGPAAVYLRYRGPEDLLYLVTPDEAIGISLLDVQPFVRALQQAQVEGAEAAEAAGLRRSGAARFGLLADRAARLLGGVALLFAWLSAAVVYARFQGKPAAIIVHFPPTEVAHLAPRSALLQIPQSAIAWCIAALLLAFLAFGRARFAAYMLLAGSVLGSAICFVAAVAATA
jgi:hypothetical protein